MMNKDEYYGEKALKELQDRKKRNLGLIEAWKSIERFRKKDGGDFEALAKNFTKGAILPARFDPEQKRVSVCTHIDGLGYESDEITITPTIYARTDEAAKYEAEGRLIQRGEYLHPYIILTPDEIELAIKTRIEQLQENVDEYSKAIEQFDEIKTKLFTLSKAVDEVLKTVPKNSYYIFREMFEGR